ncbi:cold-responsive protein kinase 1-like [Carex rostrata]
MQLCKSLGQVLWASLMIPISLPLLLLFFVASIFGFIGEFLLWLFPTHIFSKELVELGDNLASTAMKIFHWCMLKNSAVGLQNKSKGSAALQSMETLVQHVINMRQQPVPLGSRLPFTVPRSTIIYGFPKIGFTYQELAAATNGFGSSNIIGQGGFGKVYKGQLQDGRHVAIKNLFSSGNQGEKEFCKELDLLSRVHHRHLVQLIGCCVTQGNSLLVYEYITNGSLHTCLQSNYLLLTIDWPTRVKVALGSAKALAYLHESCQPRIIHRDIKSSNILLDDDFLPKMGDFGLGKLFPDDVTHIETRVAGTIGYLAPEYRSTGELNEKCDVYSYGVVLLELISGRRPFDLLCYEHPFSLDYFKEKLRPALPKKDFTELVDPHLMNQYNHDEIMRMIACGLSCTRDSPHERPPMSRIALVLGGKLSLEILGSIDSDIYSQNITNESYITNDIYSQNITMSLTITRS